MRLSPRSCVALLFLALGTALPAAETPALGWPEIIRDSLLAAIIKEKLEYTLVCQWQE